MGLVIEDWGVLPDGNTVRRFELSNSSGLKIRLSDFGGIVTSIFAPDRHGRFADIVLGYDTVDEYVRDDAFMGAMIGRYANRIKDAAFSLEGRKYSLTQNEGNNHLHGGGGFHKTLWDLEAVSDNGVCLRLFSPDGQDGFPGNLEVKAAVTLEDNRLKIEFNAVSDADTVINLTNHMYFNLKGCGDILRHEVKILADRYTPVDGDLIPAGELRPVAGTDLDFRASRPIKDSYYDHNFVLNGDLSAEVYEPECGRVMRLYTSMPGLQFYCGGSLTERVGKQGAVLGKNSGLCLEPQYFPNSPNMPGFPSCVLKAGQTYGHWIQYTFSVR